MTGMPPAQRKSLGERDADKQRADETRPLSHGDGADIGRSGAGLASAASTTPQMSRTCCTRRQLRDDAAPLAVDGGLRRDDVETDRQGRGGVTGLGDERRGGFVARGLDGEQVHGAAGLTSVEGPLQRLGVGRPEDAVLGDDAGDVAVRRDVERGIADAARPPASAATIRDA